MAAGVRETDTGYKRKAKQIVEEGECQNFNLEQEKRGVCLYKKREKGVNDQVRLKKVMKRGKKWSWRKIGGSLMEGMEEKGQGSKSRAKERPLKMRVREVMKQKEKE